MKKFILHIAVILILTPLLCYAQGVSFDNSGGTINNKGTIRVNGGQVKSFPDTIGGRVEFSASCPAATQGVPNIAYNQLVIKGQSVKYIDSLSNRNGIVVPLSTVDSLLMIDSANVELFKETIYALGPVENTVSVSGNKEIRLKNEISSQDLWGTGNFPILNIDNPNGVNVIRNGGFSINKRLELTRGILRNGPQNNFTMKDSSVIVRHIEGSLQSEPLFEKNVDLQYVGVGQMVAGPEVPTDSTVVKDLLVANTGGLILSKNMTVKDSITLFSSVNTEPDSNQYVLTLTSKNDPVFTNPGIEIIGSFRRTNLSFDSTTILFNNQYTYAIFANPAAANGATELTFRIKPRTFPPFMNGNAKVRRFIQISARDTNYAPVKFGLNLKLGYGWRYSSDTAIDEENNLPLLQLKLQKWTGSAWVDEQQESFPKYDTTNEWAYNHSIHINSTGIFAIGMPGNSLLFNLAGKAILEGDYRFGSMAFDLNTKQLIPHTPPDIYPYNLDPRRAAIIVANIPDSVVDWVVLEFRTKMSGGDKKYLTCFLKSDGTIVGKDGNSPINLYNEGIDSGDFYVVIYHRNHLPVITANAIQLYPTDQVPIDIDFSRPDNLLGGTDALKLLGLSKDGSLLFGMFAGDVNGDGKIDQNDLISTWEDRDYDNVYMNQDVDLSGFINMRDWNIVWNNANYKNGVINGRSSYVP